MMNALSYSEVWVLDFEFIAKDGEHPLVVCMVAHELISGVWVRIWQGNFNDPPFSLGEDALFIAFCASAEWSCFLALGWDMPARCVDLYAEFIRIHNGSANGKLFPGLLAAASYYGISTMDADHKGAMRELILTGGPWSKSERAQIFEYCEVDVRITSELLRALLPKLSENALAFGGALLRGRYTQAVSRMEWNGIPIDVDALIRLRNGWDHIKLKLIAQIDRDFGVYEGTTFIAARFEDWIKSRGISWPKHSNGRIKLDDDTFRQQAKIHTEIAPLRELRHALGQMKLHNICAGVDGRNRVSLMPFGSRTGRNQPSNSKFIFGASRWLRSLIRAEPGHVIAYIDWVSQEIAIAAALSGDTRLWEAYQSGDPYMAFARDAGLVPPGATKHTHKAERQRAKAIVLGVGYGMSAEAMAIQAGIHIDEARDLLLQHKLTYQMFWKFATKVQNAGLMGQVLQTRFGWEWKAGQGTDVNPRALLNWPMQANGAEMLRLACCLMTEKGIKVCCPVHDAVLIEAPAKQMKVVVEKARELMEKASEFVLGPGFVVKTDVEIVAYPDRYEDEAGIAMWDRVNTLLTESELSAGRVTP